MGPRAGWGNLEMGVAKWANNPWEGVRIRLAGQQISRLSLQYLLQVGLG